MGKKGEPYRHVKDRAHLLLRELPDAELREVINRLIQIVPCQTLDVLAEYHMLRDELQFEEMMVQATFGYGDEHA